MGACYSTDKGDEVQGVSNWGTYPATNYSYNVVPHYGNYQEDIGSRCIICSSQMEKIELGDGRKLCRSCFSSSIMSREELEPIIESILEFFKDKGLMVEKSTPVFLITKDDMVRILTERVRPEGSIRVDPSNMSTISHGFTTRSKWKISSVISCSQRGNLMEVTKDFKTTRHKESSVLIMYGFPRVFTTKTLAHEMMHVWFNSQGVGNELPLSVNEGLCDLMAKMWLDERCHDSTGLKNLAIYNINNRVAYREAEAAVRSYGLGNTLPYVLKYKKLPI